MQNGRRIRLHRVLLAMAPLVAMTALMAQDGSRGLVTVKATGSIEQIKGNAGRRYAICIGINDFADPEIPPLKGARNDALELSQTLKEFGQFDRVERLTDDIDPRDPRAATPGSPISARDSRRSPVPSPPMISCSSPSRDTG